MVAGAICSRPDSFGNMRVGIPLLYLMPVLVLSDLAAAASKDASRDRVTQSSSRGGNTVGQAANQRRVQQPKSTQPPPTNDTDGDKKRRYNVILILTDDQDVELGSLNFMSETSRLFRGGGTEFRHAYTTTPMCCPSRSSILTGLYAHNHNVYTNNDNCSNFEWQMEHETRSFAAYLEKHGYHTGYFGKYLNKYNGSYVPPGWTEWGGLITNSKYYNYSINLNGQKIRHGDDYSKDYYTNLVANDSIRFLEEWKMWRAEKPLLLVMSFPAPHGPEDSAPEYSNMFMNVTTHHTPSYDYAPNPDKQWILQVTGPMTPVHKRFTNMLMTKRLQTLQSVDAAVKRVFEQLETTDNLKDTYVIYTSDHGYHLGQFGLVKGKSFPFEFDVRIPFLVRGPGIQPGSIVNEVALNIDLAPTILEMAGITPPPHMDGKSLLALFKNKRSNKQGRKPEDKWPDTFLIESSGRREMPFLSANLDASISDPTSTSGGVTNETTTRTTTTTTMSEHHTDDGLALEEHHPRSKAERLSIECQRPEYATPCKRGQKWHCVLKNNRWRKHKCKFNKRASQPAANLHKCTCVTVDGIVYMRFQTIDNHTAAKSMEKLSGVRYLKSEQSSGEVFNTLANSWGVMKRRRRNTGNKWERTRAISIVNVFDGQMIELLNLDSGANDTACMVQFDGSVTCSPEVYRNHSLWRESYKSLLTRIKWLQSHVKKLKEIQHHLENMQPAGGHSNGIEHHRHNASNNASSHTEAGDNSITRASATESLSSHKHRHHHDETVYATMKIPELGLPDDANLNSKLAQDNSIPDPCVCTPHSPTQWLSVKDKLLKEQKRRTKEQRAKKKERKIRKRAKLGESCFLEKMNCFNHDKDHWQTPPYWTDDSFCFCVNAINNTYNCIRTINATHNFLYCEFVTGLTTYYNMRIDPFQQWNRINSLSPNDKHWLSRTLSQMVNCKGYADCNSSFIAREAAAKKQRKESKSKSDAKKKQNLRAPGS